MRSLQNVALVMACVGFMGVVVVCSLPMWKKSTYSWNAEKTFMQGLWKTCVEKRGSGHFKCEDYVDERALPHDLRAARVQVLFSIMVTLLGILLNIIGRTFFLNRDSKLKVLVISGVFMVAGGFLCLIPVSLSAHDIITTAKKPHVREGQKRRLGDALFLGWIFAGFLFVAGGIVMSQTFNQALEDQEPAREPAREPDRHEYGYFYVGPRAQDEPAVELVVETSV